MKKDNYPIDYINVNTNDSYGLGYGLCKEFWHKGIVTQASKAVIEQLKKDGIPYITATHDINNPRSGGVMEQLGMKYQYSYKEQWQPKDILVTFSLTVMVAEFIINTGLIQRFILLKRIYNFSLVGELNRKINRHLMEENMLQYFDEFYMTDVQTTIINKCNEVYELLKKAYWAKDRSELVTYKAIRSSLNYAIFEANSERLVGFARVVTDYSTVYYLCDIYIDEEFRGKGLGKKLVEWIVLYEDKLFGVNGLLKL